MSAAPARLAPRPSPRPAPAPARPQLRVVALHRPEASRVPYIGLLVAILLVAMLGALSLQTSMAATSYAIRNRTVELTNAQQQLEALSTQVDQASAPAQVMAKAQELGLVPSDGVIYIRLSDGTLIGGS
ncbi:hypothetical protein EDD28_3277 [Salana multivorans]|uniref:Cell division protein FtsL n=1 Tax=Salana multivorans TaxID=120377 RepID=A0A3N2D251_9MICO|nr:hypothetical protein [Salana multivorans]MBN8882927.1 hypothetical protein [Salana multivorans]OJX95612.1 MAG: hypothetical protein BGO96_08210 [Micrococcales bacterium 73-15]ROR93849.1 hypothetical protein EDD28_3277 [Salana multivorans]